MTIIRPPWQLKYAFFLPLFRGVISRFGASSGFRNLYFSVCVTILNPMNQGKPTQTGGKLTTFCGCMRPLWRIG